MLYLNFLFVPQDAPFHVFVNFIREQNNIQFLHYNKSDKEITLFSESFLQFFIIIFDALISVIIRKQTIRQTVGFPVFDHTIPATSVVGATLSRANTLILFRVRHFGPPMVNNKNSFLLRHRRYPFRIRQKYRSGQTYRRALRMLCDTVYSRAWMPCYRKSPMACP